MFKKLTLIFLLTSIYTITRYIVFGNVSPIQMPAYLLNKSVALATVIFLFLAATQNGKDKVKNMKFWGTASFQSALIHIFLSLALYSKAYYPKFFAVSKMNLTGELVLMFGVLATFFFWLVRNTPSDFSYRRWLRIFSLIMISGHLAAMGLGGWLTPEKWQGGLPPISLIGFTFTIISLVFLFKNKGINIVANSKNDQ